MTYLFLIRHGENDWVGSNRLAGRTPGVHLNEKGKQQALGLTDQLAEQPIHAIYSSPLERCMETAQPLADKLGLTVQPEPGIIEVDYGEWRGKNLKELSNLPEWKAVQHQPSAFRFPAGETLRETQQRAISTIERIRSQHPNQGVVLFSHGDVIRTSIAHYIGTPLDLFQRIIISTGSISVIQFGEYKSAVLAVNYLTNLPVFELKKET